MKKKIKFTLVGGDKRQRDVIYILAQEGFSINVLGFLDTIHENVKIFNEPNEDLFDCHVLMLPIPYKNNKGQINFHEMDTTASLETIMRSMRKGTVVIFGKADNEFIEIANRYQVPYYDLLNEESFAVLNAIPTAEGAIQRAMERTDITLHEANILLLGFGRVGKILARMLTGLGAYVTIEARKNEDLAWIRGNGYRGVHLDEVDSIISKQDIIFNTVPFLILDRSRLSKVNSECVIIDLASYPGGCDFIAAKDFGINANLDLSLPGIVAPKTAAKIIYQVTKEIMERHFHYDIMGG